MTETEIKNTIYKATEILIDFEEREVILHIKLMDIFKLEYISSKNNGLFISSNTLEEFEDIKKSMIEKVKLSIQVVSAEIKIYKKRIYLFNEILYNLKNDKNILFIS